MLLNCLYINLQKNDLVQWTKSSTINWSSRFEKYYPEMTKNVFIFQAFIRDTEHVDSLSASHEAFLSNDDLGVWSSSLNVYLFAFHERQ